MGPPGPGEFQALGPGYPRGKQDVPTDQHDETDDVGGHRIYLNPWADESDYGEDEGILVGLIEEYPDER